MKRRGYVMESVCDMDNLRLAYWKACRGKQGKREVIAYRRHWQENLTNLSQLLSRGEIPRVKYHYFKIYDPKERQICATSLHHRVLQHALMNICHQDFERFQTNDSFASRLGRGTYAALSRAISHQRRYRYCLKLDIRKYFDTICHDILIQQLHRMYKDAKLLNIFQHIIDSYAVTAGRGLPIGNLTSQYFANHYLGVADHYVREVLHVRAYVRYMDDMLLWDDDPSRLLRIGKAFRDFIEDRLGLEMKIFSLHPTTQMCTFLGYSISKYTTSLSRHSLKRFQRHLKSMYWKYDECMMTQEDMCRHLQPVLAFTRHVSSNDQRAAVLNRI